MTSPASTRGGSLSARERQVLGLAAQGATDRKISLQLQVSPTTVQTYWRRIWSKLGAVSRCHAVALHMTAQASASQGAADLALAAFRRTSVAFWVWNPATRRISLDETAQTLFGIDTAADDLPLEAFLSACSEPDRWKLESFLGLGTDMKKLGSFRHRLSPGNPDEAERVLRTVVLAFQPDETFNTLVLLASMLLV